jgi:DNA-binding IclR family transcriptional regulator
MACVNPDGTLSKSGQAMLKAVASPLTAAEVASATGLAVFRVRGGLRDLVAAGLVVEDDGRFAATSHGKST